ncbi:hypothetical protein EWB00_003715 [Schistosoma japonicum]|uniref:Uncharacterized protein n=1 Tax=Schistosoma japonicum TaxID=6182 RepID=A0A4Z2D7F1_SCHJA|nr:hypothetical protein EWB00_003715 [Schistosoma japonicum]
MEVIGIPSSTLIWFELSDENTDTTKLKDNADLNDRRSIIPNNDNHSWEFTKRSRMFLGQVAGQCSSLRYLVLKRNECSDFSDDNLLWIKMMSTSLYFSWHNIHTNMADFTNIQ